MWPSAPEPNLISLIGSHIICRGRTEGEKGSHGEKEGEGMWPFSPLVLLELSYLYKNVWWICQVMDTQVIKSLISC